MDCETPLFSQSTAFHSLIIIQFVTIEIEGKCL